MVNEWGQLPIRTGLYKGGLSSSGIVWSLLNCHATIGVRNFLKYTEMSCEPAVVEWPLTSCILECYTNYLTFERYTNFDIHYNNISVCVSRILMKYFQTHNKERQKSATPILVKITCLTKTELRDDSKVYILGTMVLRGESCQLSKIWNHRNIEEM
jgi:hypothetical protein